MNELIESDYISQDELAAIQRRATVVRKWTGSLSAVDAAQINQDGRDIWRLLKAYRGLQARWDALFVLDPEELVPQREANDERLTELSCAYRDAVIAVELAKHALNEARAAEGAAQKAMMDFATGWARGDF